MAKKKKKVVRFGAPKTNPSGGSSGWGSGTLAPPAYNIQPAPAGAPPTAGQPYAPYQQAEAGYNRDTGNITAYYGTGNAGDPFGQRYGSMGQQLSSDYGFREKQGGGYEIDPSNPYSRAAALQRSYEQGQRGTSTSMAARGQLYSGALQSSLDHGTSQYGQMSHGLQTAYSRSLSELDLQRTDRLTAAANALANAQQGLADHYAQNPAAAPEPAQPNPAATIASDPKAAWVAAEAQRLWSLGKKSGPAWRPIIDYLKYDPRRSGGLVFH